MGGILLIGVFLSGFIQQAYQSTMSEEKMQEIKDGMLDAQISSYEAMGMEISLDQEEALINQVEGSFSLKGFLMGLPIVLLVYGVVGFVVCMIMRKEPPIPNPTI